MARKQKCLILRQFNIKLVQNLITDQSWSLHNHKPFNSGRGRAPLAGHIKPCNKTLALLYYKITTASIIPATLKSQCNSFASLHTPLSTATTDGCHWWGIPLNTSSEYSSSTLKLFLCQGLPYFLKPFITSTPPISHLLIHIDRNWKLRLRHFPLKWHLAQICGSVKWKQQYRSF